MDGLVDFASDLRSEPFLDLKPPREAVYKSSQLAHSQHLSSRDVANVTFPKERKHMMLAQGIDFDITDNDHVVGMGFEHGIIDDLVRIRAVAARQE